MTLIQALVKAGELGPYERALTNAAESSSVGQAFYAGYQAALRALFPNIPENVKAALCATEEGGVHPEALSCALVAEDGVFRLTGTKTYVTGGQWAELLFVVVTTGRDASGRKRLKVVRVSAKAEGVHWKAMAPAPFIPDIPHAQVHFDGVAVSSDDVLAGDGYGELLNPFRTVEDVHVHGCLVAWVCAVGERWDWPRAVLQKGLSLCVQGSALARLDPRSAATHLAVAGSLEATREWLAATGPLWEQVPLELRRAWQRDQRLLQVAESVRQKRTEAAWSRLLETSQAPR